MMKKALPAITAAGVFKRRTKDQLSTPAELFAIDIDNLPSTSAAIERRDALRGDPHIFAAFVSPSGHGVKAIVRTAGLHDDAAAKRLFPILQSRYGIATSIDKACKDLNRLCYLSYDPDLWINTECTPLAIPDGQDTEQASTAAHTDTEALRLIRPIHDVPHGFHGGDIDDAIQLGINTMRKAERDKSTDDGVSRHDGMLRAQLASIGKAAELGITDTEPIRDALRGEYADMMHGDADRIADFDRAWKGAARQAHTMIAEGAGRGVDAGPGITETIGAPKPSKGMPRDRMGRMITPAEMVMDGDRMEPDQYDAMHTAAAISITAVPERPPVLFSFDGHPLLTLQNISVISGKAKSRKSGFASVLAAMTINPNSHRAGEWNRMRAERLKADRPWQRSGVLLFDTEQASYHAWAMARRILHMAGRDDNGGDALRAFALRDFHPSQRLQFIAETIARHAAECSLIIIDGVRDVVLNINSEDEATLMNGWLLSVSKRHNVHIICVLHENKGTDTLRGHIGTELQNKSEAVFTVAKGTTKSTRDISAVETTVSRNRGMERIGIESVEWEGDDGLRLWIPTLIDDDRAERIGKAGEGDSADAAAISDSQHHEMLRSIWADDPTSERTASDLRDAITAHGGAILGRKLSERTTKGIIADWQGLRRWIVDNGSQTRGRKYRLIDPSIVRPVKAAEHAMRMNFASGGDSDHSEQGIRTK